ncbi:chemotaxis protein CheW [Methylorubrum sp. SB2]|uniref:chemotaxis protein CheW n=1 Tax=Methylorubrum subtropicum TaxID=3138812 RepID=UPI00313A82EF
MAGAAHLIVDVAGTPCALPQADIREILPLPRLHAPPTVGGPVAGLLDLGGEPVPVVDLAVLFGLRDEAATDDPYRHIVLARGRPLGLLVDRALDVVTVAGGSLKPVDPARSLNGCVVAEFAHGKGLVHLLSLDCVLTFEERARLDAFALSARQRLARFGSPEAARPA